MYFPEGIPHRPEADSFDLRGSLARIVDACRAYRGAFLATVVFTMVLAVAYLWLFPPIYVAEVLVVSEGEKDLPRENFYQLWNVFRREQLTNESELITSRPVLAEVVRELGLKYEDVYHPFTSHATYLWTDSWVGKSYRKVKLFFFPRRKTPYDPTPEQIEMGRTVEDFQAGAELKPVPESSVGRLTVRGPSPRVAEIANKLADTYIEQRRRRFVEEAKRAHAALQGQVEIARKELRVLEKQRREFSEKNGLLLDFEKEKLDVAAATELEGRIADDEAKVAALARKLAVVRTQRTGEAPDIITARVFQTNPLRERMRIARFEMQASLDAIRLRYRPDSPEVLEMQARIKDLDVQIASEQEKIEQSTSRTLNSLHEDLRKGEAEIAADLRSLEAGLVVRKRTLARLNEQVLRIPGKVDDASDLSRAMLSTGTRHQVLNDRLMMAQVSIAAAGALSSMRVDEYASAPSEPVWPKAKAFVPVAFLVALIAGTLLALLMDLVQGRVTRTRLLQTRLGLPVYGPLVLAPLPRALAAADTDQRPTGKRANGAQG